MLYGQDPEVTWLHWRQYYQENEFSSKETTVYITTIVLLMA